MWTVKVKLYVVRGFSSFTVYSTRDRVDTPRVEDRGSDNVSTVQAHTHLVHYTRYLGPAVPSGLRRPSGSPSWVRMGQVEFGTSWSSGRLYGLHRDTTETGLRVGQNESYSVYLESVDRLVSDGTKLFLYPPETHTSVKKEEDLRGILVLLKNKHSRGLSHLNP